MVKSDNNTSKKPKFDTSSASGIVQLLLLFLWVLIKKTLRLLLKITILFFYYIYKGIKRFIAWWQDGDTKEKRKELWQIIKDASIKIGKWIAIGSIILWKGIIWTIKKTGHGLLHLRSTLIFIGKAIVAWIKKMREKDYRTIIREKNAKMKQSITEFVTETDDDIDENGESEEELLREMNEKKKGNNAFDNAVERFTKYL